MIPRRIINNKEFREFLMRKYDAVKVHISRKGRLVYARANELDQNAGYVIDELWSEFCNSDDVWVEFSDAS
jgi:hypothetical protein